jgi:dual 3',5'-cyclic-AMP and -GMP phosphodiesterase 11
MSSRQYEHNISRRPPLSSSSSSIRRTCVVGGCGAPATSRFYCQTHARDIASSVRVSSRTQTYMPTSAPDTTSTHDVMMNGVSPAFSARLHQRAPAPHHTSANSSHHSNTHPRPAPVLSDRLRAFRLQSLRDLNAVHAMQRVGNAVAAVNVGTTLAHHTYTSGDQSQSFGPLSIPRQNIRHLNGANPAVSPSHSSPRHSHYETSPSMLEAQTSEQYDSDSSCEASNSERPDFMRASTTYEQYAHTGHSPPMSPRLLAWQLKQLQQHRPTGDSHMNGNSPNAESSMTSDSKHAPQAPQAPQASDMMRAPPVRQHSFSVRRTNGQSGSLSLSRSKSARSLWNSGLHSVKFVKRVANLHTLSRKSRTIGHGTSQEEFQNIIQSLNRRDLVKTSEYLFHCLKQFRLLLDETRSMSTDLDHDDTFTHVVHRMQNVVNAEHVSLFVMDKEHECLYAKSSTKELEMVVPIGQGFVGHVAQTKSILRVESKAYEDDRYTPKYDKELGILTCSTLVVPVLNRQRECIAVLIASNKCTPNDDSSQCFSEEDEQVSEFLSYIVGQSIQNAILYQEAVSRRTHTETMLQISELLSSEVDTHKIIDRVLQASAMLVPAERVSLFIVNEAKESLIESHTGVSRSPLIVPLNSGIIGYAATTRKCVNVHNAAEDWRCDATHASDRGIEMGSVLAVPVLDHSGRTVAVIEVLNRQGGIFSHADEQLLQSMAVNAGISLRKAQLYEDAIARRAQTEALLQITETLSSELEVNTITQKIVTAAYMLVPVERIALYTVDERTHELVCISDSTGMRVPIGRGVVGHVAVTGQIVKLDDVQSDWRYDRKLEERYHLDSRNVLVVPVKDYLGKTVAVLEAVNRKSTPDNGTRRNSLTIHTHTEPVAAVFSNDDVAVLNSLAVTAGSVLRKAQLYDEAIRHRRQTEALLQISELMSAAIGSTEKVMASIIEASYSLVHADRISLFIANRLAKEVVCCVSRDPAMVNMRIPFGTGLVGHVALTSRTLNISEPYRDPRFSPHCDQQHNYRTESILTVPVTDRSGAVVAVIQALNRKDAPGFTHEDQNILEAMAASAGLILHKAQLYEDAVVAETKSRALMNLVKASSTEGSIHDIISSVVRVAYDAVCADRVTIYFVDHVKSELWCIVSKDEEGWQLPLGSGLAGYCAEHSTVLNIPNAYEDPRFDSAFDEKSGYKTQSVLCFPIVDREGTTVAVLQAINKTAPDGAVISFTTGDEEMLEAFSVELKTLLRRHLTDAMLEHSLADESVYSLMDMYMRNPVSPFKSDRSPVAGRNQEMYVWPDIKNSRLQMLNTLEFNVWQCTEDDLLVLSFRMFQEMDLIQTFQIPVDTLRNFFVKVRRSYRDNPFHNWVHAFSVLHVTYLQLLQTQASQWLTSLDVLGVLVAAICHDIDHPGHTNSFEINSESRLAMLHNDLSPLENHHAYYTCSIVLRDEECNIFQNVTKENRRSLKAIIVQAILATDMTIHFDTIKRLDSLNEPFFNIQNESDRQDAVNMLIHSADLSGQLFATHVAIEWEERITREFVAQAQYEKEKNLPVVSFMQNLTDPVQRAKNQVNFCDFVLIPYWRSVVRLLPQLKSWYLNLLTNRQYYKMLANPDVAAASSKTTSASMPCTPSDHNTSSSSIHGYDTEPPNSAPPQADAVADADADADAI